MSLQMPMNFPDCEQIKACSFQIGLRCGATFTSLRAISVQLINLIKFDFKLFNLVIWLIKVPHPKHGNVHNEVLINHLAKSSPHGASFNAHLLNASIKHESGREIYVRKNCSRYLLGALSSSLDLNRIMKYNHGL